jgi:GT2 family glycosyltransferase
MFTAFIILHYISLNDTLDCVNSIRSLHDNEDSIIIVVDNASPNGSGKELMNFQDNRMIVLLNNHNLGFSAGNNVGIRYAIEHYQPSFIVLANNDIIFTDTDFLLKIRIAYAEYDYALLGPKILTPHDVTGKCNPKRNRLISKNELNTFIFETSLYYFFSYLLLDGFFKSLFKMIKNTVRRCRKSQKYENTIDHDAIHINVQLHGCCWVLSKRYFDFYEGLDESTFLYMEEDFLLYQIISRQLKSIYYPDITVYHNEQVATKLAFKGIAKYNRFRYKYGILSAKALKKIIIGE